MTTLIAFIIVLGVLVFFHELGHFLLARLCGVGVEKFSLGFGPRILGKTIGRTDYRISAIPLGGYVKMVGEEPDAEIDEKDIPYSFTHKNVYQRMLIVAAGPLFNVFLAILIYFFFFQVYGDIKIEPVVGGFLENSPALEAGLEKGDRILSINGKTIDTFDSMILIVAQSSGDPLAFKVKRGTSELDLSITPAKVVREIFGEDVDTYMVGISNSQDHVHFVKLNSVEAFVQSISQTWMITRTTFLGIGQMIKGEISPKTLGGPIMIAKMAGDQAKRGPLNLIYFIAFISINLAILNILPIPILDGGHLLFYTIEAVTGTPISLRAREIAQQIGLVILLFLIIFVFYNDIVREFF